MFLSTTCIVIDVVQFLSTQCCVIRLGKQYLLCTDSCFIIVVIGDEDQRFRIVRCIYREKTLIPGRINGMQRLFIFTGNTPVCD